MASLFIRAISLSTLLAFFSPGVFASDLFTVTLITNPGQSSELSQTINISNAEDAIRQFDNDQFVNYFGSSFDPNTTPIQANIDFRGLPIVLVSDGTNINLAIQSIELNKTFTGTSRDQSLNQLVNFFESDGGALLDKIQKELAAASPVDPVAGNPTSLQSSLVSSTFSENAFDTSSVGQTTSQTKSSADEVGNVLKIGLSAGRFSSANISGTSIPLSLGYTFRSSSNPERQLKLSMPLQLVMINDARIYSAGLGLTFRLPVTRQWAISPGVLWGAAGSVDAASAAQMLSYSMTSQYKFNLSKMSVTIGNMVGKTQTLKFKMGNYSSNPDINNVVYRNGFQAELPAGFHLFGTDCSAEFSVVNTSYTGDALYLKNYNDVAVSLGRQHVEGAGLLNYLRAGLTYTFGKDYKAYSFNLGYSF